MGSSFDIGYIAFDKSVINLSAGQNDNVACNNTRGVFVPTNDGDSISGIDFQVYTSGTLLFIINPHPTKSIILLHNNASSSAENRLFMPDGIDLKLGPKQTVPVGYNEPSGGWNVQQPPYAIYNYNSSGILRVSKQWHGLITPNTGNGYSVDISSAGFTNVINVQAIGVKNTSTATSSPQISIKSVSTTTIVVNITEASANLVTILGSSVLQGPAAIFADTTGLTFYLLVQGN